MFYYSNGKITVLSYSRCGHTNMYNYFGLPTYSLALTPIQHSDDLVVVIRNPIDRMVSAVKGITPYLPDYTPDAKWLDLSSLAGKSTDEIREEVLFSWHCKPYMSSLAFGKFRIIDFYKLDQYIPKTSLLAYSRSPITNTSGLTGPKEHYVENSVFSLADLEEEYELYLEIIQTHDQISVEEWKSLTP